MKDKIRLEVMKIFDQQANVDDVVNNILNTMLEIVLPVELESFDVFKYGDVFLWSGRSGKYEVYVFHSDVGYGIKTFTDYNKDDGSSLIVNYSGVCGKIVANSI